MICVDAGIVKAGNNAGACKCFVETFAKMYLVYRRCYAGLIHEGMSQLAERDAFHTLESGNLFDPVNRDVYEQDTAGAVADSRPRASNSGSLSGA